jgi:hypothetical protein
MIRKDMRGSVLIEARSPEDGTGTGTGTGTGQALGSLQKAGRTGSGATRGRGR